MKQTITKSMFIDAFVKAGRKDQFSYDALCAIYQFITDIEYDTGEEYELDVIGICCEWTESTIQEVIDDYDIDIRWTDDVAQDVEEWLRDRTSVACADSDTIVYVKF